jgi:hypothetical protein
MKIESKHKVISAIQHELTIEFEWEEVESRVPDINKEFKKNSTFDGFRKGKAPESVVRAKVGEKLIWERAAEKAAYDAFNQALKDSRESSDDSPSVPAEIGTPDGSKSESGLPQPIMPPEIKLDELKEGEPVKFTAKYYVQPPDPAKLAEEYQKTKMPELISPDDIFPEGPPNIQSHGPYSVPTDILKNIPGVNLADSFIPKVLPQTANPEAQVPKRTQYQPEIPDPESLIKAPKVKPEIGDNVRLGRPRMKKLVFISERIGRCPTFVQFDLNTTSYIVLC